MKISTLIVAVLLLAGISPVFSEPVPLCLRVDTDEMVPCYSKEAIKAARRALHRMGVYDARSHPDNIINVWMQEGIRDPDEIARWIKFGDR